MYEKDINSFFSAQRTRSFHNSNDLKEKKNLHKSRVFKTDQNKSALN